jgi:cellulose synthase/poly-beta-1,6-N-acetylglucosamine synthase-like glycosyltransferase
VSSAAVFNAPSKLRIVALVPAHNEAASIGTVIEALLAQDRQPDQIVVVSDNSTDDTFAIARSYAGVTAIETVANVHKKSGALNLAWRTFCQDADLVVTLDADTILAPNAVGDWEGEFLADLVLAGSSSKFTMLGSKLLVRLQRFEFAMWTDTSLRRGWTSVLAGTGCCIRNEALRAVTDLDDREGPWSYESQVEDFELTYQIRQLGYHCHVSPTVRAYTDAMDTIRALWGQRMKWQVGTVEDLRRFGYNRLTRLDWRQQVAGLLFVFVRLSWVVLLVWGALLGVLTFTPIWLVMPVLFAAADVKRARRIPHRDVWDVVLAACLLPQELFAWLRAGWFLASWWEVLVAGVTGRRKDHWTLQYAAEEGR